MLIRLDKRLAEVARHVRLDKRICDIGTDHALLPCFLRQKGAERVVAADINDGPLVSARVTMETHGIDGIELIKSNGLERIPPCDDIIIAGMGGRLICEILGGLKFRHDDLRLILQPMNNVNELRFWLYQNGFEIISESAVNMGIMHYAIIHAKPNSEIMPITHEQAFVGKMRDMDYLNWELSVQRIIVDGLAAAKDYNPRFEREKALLKALEAHIKEVKRQNAKH